ncbi:MAG: hypothetical protein IKM88_06325 [Lachnospiraceae bacterium]|nr:hypothetical protein [Lachnospiraceae bacterium]
MLTAKENMRQCIIGGKPDRVVNQYEGIALLFHPFLLASPLLKKGDPPMVNAWGVTNAFPDNVPGAFPVHTPDKIVVQDIEHWRDYVHAPSLDFPEELWNICQGMYDAVDGNKAYKATCAEGGTISPLSGIIGSYQANEALKLIIGIGEHLNGRLLRVDTLGLQSSVVKIKKNCDCPVCGSKPTITEVEDFDYEEFCGLKAEEDEIPVEGFTPEELASRIDAGDAMTIIDVREPHERAIKHFPGAIAIPIGQLARRQKELNPELDTVFICKEGKRSILAINTLREAGYKGPMYNLKGGMDAMKDIMFSNEAGWL